MKNILKKNRIYIFAGLLITLLSCLPYFLLQEASIVTYHDQLDGEILTYIYGAKYLFSNSSTFQELMNGINRTGLTMPAPAFVIFYRFFPPFVAYLISLIVIKMVGFIGTYLLIREITEKKWLAFLCGCGFMLLPFYAVYGLCVPGEPLLLYAILNLRDKDSKPWKNWLLIALYVAGSSLALVGFAWIAFLCIAFVVAVIRKRNVLRYAIATCVCVGGYVAENIDLVRQILGLDDGFVSHKSEIVRISSPFVSSFWQIFTEGAEYTKVGQKYFFPAIILAFVAFALFRFAYKNRSPLVDREIKYLSVGLGINVILALLYAIYNSEVVIKFCNSKTGALHDFNFGRIVWIMPVIWIAMLGMSLSILWDLYASILINEKTSIFAQMIRYGIRIAYICGVLATIGLFAIKGFLASDLKYNISKLLKKDYYMMTWEQFFAEDLFAEVDELIGLDKETYRVVSLGIYPSAAAYNGFYCLDAYSNNYDVEYKHEFRKIIAPELDKSEYLSQWYDCWGNRCYIVLAESMNYFTFEKRWIPTTKECDLDLEQLRNMGCHYMISASYIFDAEDMGMTLLNEEPIQSEESWYRLWVYRF